jgi:hypothetical protein
LPKILSEMAGQTDEFTTKDAKFTKKRDRKLDTAKLKTTSRIRGANTEHGKT